MNTTHTRTYTQKRKGIRGYVHHRMHCSAVTIPCTLLLRNLQIRELPLHPARNPVTSHDLERRHGDAYRDKPATERWTFICRSACSTRTKLQFVRNASKPAWPSWTIVARFQNLLTSSGAHRHKMMHNYSAEPASIKRMHTIERNGT